MPIHVVFQKPLREAKHVVRIVEEERQSHPLEGERNAEPRGSRSQLQEHRLKY